MMILLNINLIFIHIHKLFYYYIYLNYINYYKKSYQKSKISKSIPFFIYKFIYFFDKYKITNFNENR